MGKFDTKNPAGVFVMENSFIQMEHGQNISFAFSISFIDENDRRHMFAARSEDNIVQWVMKLRTCSYEYLRNRLHALQSKIFSITGKDPLLMVPRNEGAKLWAPAVPFSTAPACNVSTSSFNCHLHVNGAFTLERSKSDVQAHNHLKNEYRKKTTFYTDDCTDVIKNEIDVSFPLEKSKTSVLSQGRLNPFDQSIFDNRPLYSRAAPSPPLRKKPSPSSRRVETQVFVEKGKNLAQTGILDPMPIPPRRKVSPRTQNLFDLNNEESCSSGPSSDKTSEAEDLIKF